MCADSFAINANNVSNGDDDDDDDGDRTNPLREETTN